MCKKNSLICKSVMHCYQTYLMIGLTYDQIMELTNHGDRWTVVLRGLI